MPVTTGEAISGQIATLRIQTLASMGLSTSFDVFQKSVRDDFKKLPKEEIEGTII